jgi:uncharacterized membrane protein YkoI
MMAEIEKEHTTMRITKKKAILTGAIVAALALGGTGVAMASSDDTTSNADTEEQDATYTGSVKAPAGSGVEGSDNAASEAAESEALASLATTTTAEATAAAQAAVAGTVGDVVLENENGYVVYGVEITTANGSTVDVKVDAGNGSILAKQAGDTETNDGAGDGETNGDAGDGDGETNDD